MIAEKKLTPSGWSLLYHFYKNDTLDAFFCNSVPRTVFSIKSQVIKSLRRRGLIIETGDSAYTFRITTLGIQMLHRVGFLEKNDINNYLRRKKCKNDIDGYSRFR